MTVMCLDCPILLRNSERTSNLGSRELITDSELENGAPSLEDRCQILRQKIGSLEADIFRSGIAPTNPNWISY
jgi:hypothetical protein